MVASSLSWFGKTRRDDAHPLVAHGVADGEQALLNHAEQDEAILAVVLPPVLADHAEGILEGEPGGIEGHAVSGEVLRCLVIIPFEIVIFQDTTAMPYLARVQPIGRAYITAPICQGTNSRSP